MRWIYLSPHFDDAILSCGGLIAGQSRRGLPVEIWTICAGYPPPGPLSDFARLTHQAWGTGDGTQTVELRRQEDEQAASCVGADLVHFDIPDCIYRLAPSGEALYPESVFGPPRPEEADMPGRIATALGSELLPGDILVAPLALGGHVDHRLVRQAIDGLDFPRFYYADIPYLLNNPETLAPAAAGLQAQRFPVSSADLRLWLDGIAAYQSQLGSLLKGEGTLETAVRRYWRDRRGLQLWQLPAMEST
jgi:LmbE family N-acetylglucosaminyl deacetylase